MFHLSFLIKAVFAFLTIYFLGSLLLGILKISIFLFLVIAVLRVFNIINFENNFKQKHYFKTVYFKDKNKFSYKRSKWEE